MRPPFKYVGSKWTIAPWILSHWPIQTELHRIVLFAGSLGVELQAPPAKLVTINDLDGDIINFFQVLRDIPASLVTVLNLTPWHKSEFARAFEPTNDPLEKARRFWIRCQMSIPGGPNATMSDFRYQKNPQGRYSPIPHEGLNLSHLYDFARKLKEAQFFQEDAIQVVDRFKDTPNTFFWADPPYLHSTRKRKSYYKIEAGDDFHKKLAGLLCDVAGYVIVAGYNNMLYNELYSGWQRFDKEAVVNGGKKQTESLWVSPPTWRKVQHDRNYKLLPLWQQGKA